MATHPISSPPPSTCFSPEHNQKNKFEYLYFDLSTAFYKSLQSPNCDCVAIATKVFILALPILFILEAILDLAAFPFFWVANYICQDAPSQARVTPPPISTLNHPEIDLLPTPPTSQPRSPPLPPDPILPTTLELECPTLTEELVSPLPEPSLPPLEIVQIENVDTGPSRLTRTGQILNDYVVQSWPVQKLIYRPVTGIWNYVFKR